ncbi:hypothetical protein SAMN04487916_105120 [Arthrobacter sp. ov407]|uniref:hypothetical protein n=1 Tax=Arthrobacter sp. ov407 TaxID=1761748 RepID=UPI0008865E91|nr:hypothetical protein [Arthrobacter sp. ov407]SDL03753.1 hypothetical protein SAMN04487916_105120 [Arthrobacter sp. ov407]
MVSSLFPPRLQGLIAKALGSSAFITQSDLDILWTGFGSGDYPPNGNKPTKANALVRSIAQDFNPDARFLDMLNDVYYFSGESNRRRQDAEAFKPLLVALLERNFIIDDAYGIKKPDAATLTSNLNMTDKNPRPSAPMVVPAVSQEVGKQWKK